MNTRKEIRHALRAQRRALTESQRRQAARALLRNLRACGFFLAAHRVAAYLPNDGEIDPGAAIGHLWRAGREVYLPVVRADRKLDFARYRPDTPLRRNRYGIPEPAPGCSTVLTARQLDLALMPLVAFDPSGNRLGMGGGYFDRTFAYLRHRAHWKKPFLAGVAFDFQRMNAITAREWDIAAQKIVTDRAIYG